MEEIKLNVQVRNQFGSRNVKKIRRQDLLPAIVYGGDKEPTPVQLDRRLYEKIMRQHKGQSVIFHIDLYEGQKKLRDYSAILKEEQHDPLSDRLIHIDFDRISLTEEIEIKIPIHVKGESIGVKQNGGSLDILIRELDIVCLPTQIPAHLEVDVTHLMIGDAVHVKDIVLPEGVKTKHHLDSIVVTVAAPMKEEVAAPEAPQLTEPEVLREKKKEETKEEGAEKKAEKPEKKEKADK